MENNTIEDNIIKDVRNLFGQKTKTNHLKTKNSEILESFLKEKKKIITRL